MLRQYLPPGATIGPTGGAAGSTAYLRKVSGAMNRILLPVDGNGYTRFYLESPDVLFFDGLAGQIMVGDVVFIPGTDGSGSWPVYVYGKATPGNTAKVVLKSQLAPPMAEGTFPVGCPIGAVTKVDVGRNYIGCGSFASPQ